jgi:hypothetical protein
MNGRVAGLAQSRWSYLFLVLLAFLAFGNSLGNYFFLDDFWHLQRIALVDWTEWWKPWSRSAEDSGSYWMAMHRIREMEPSAFFFRPAVTLVFGFSEWLGSGAAWAFHLSSVLLHTLNTLLFFGLARRLLGANAAALGAAALFAVHPAHCEAVQWIGANADLLAGLFYLVAVFGHVRASLETSISGVVRWTLVAVAGFGLALSSKEAAITFPAVVVLYEFTCHRAGGRGPWRPPWRRLLGVLALYAGIALLYLARHMQVIASVTDMNEGGIYIADWRSWGFLSAIVVNLVAYLWHFWTMFPVLPLDTREALVVAWWLVIPTWLAIIGLFVWLSRKVSDRRRHTFFWGWQVVTVFPALPILMSQRVLYIPSMGFFLLIGLLLKDLWLPRLETGERRVWLVPVAVVVCGLVPLGTNTMWRRPAKMVSDQVDQIVEQLPSPEQGGQLYLIDIWPPSRGIEEGLRRRYPGKELAIEVLSFSPKIMPDDEPPWSRPLERLFATYYPDEVGPLRTRHRLARAADGTIRLHLELEEDRYFQGLMESLLPVEHRLGTEVLDVATERFHVTVEPEVDGTVRRLDLDFPDSGRAAYFLIFEDGRYRQMPWDQE